MIVAKITFKGSAHVQCDDEDELDRLISNFTAEEIASMVETDVEEFEEVDSIDEDYEELRKAFEKGQL